MHYGVRTSNRRSTQHILVHTYVIIHCTTPHKHIHKYKYAPLGLCSSISVVVLRAFPAVSQCVCVFVCELRRVSEARASETIVRRCGVVWSGGVRCSAVAVKIVAQCAECSVCNSSVALLSSVVWC